MQNKELKFIFWGTGPLAESSLFALYQNKLIPSLVITSPDKEVGRGKKLQKNIIATWCEAKNIKVWQPYSLKNLDIKNSPLAKEIFDISIVASYPKILAEEILDLPKYGSLNIHPSLLPKYRGPSPIQTALLNGDTKTGITIIKLDEKIDHGPILIQKEIDILEEDINEKLERKCGALGGEMISQILEHYLNENIKLIPQKDSEATFTKKFEKKDGEISLETPALEVQNKFRALPPHVSIFFWLERKNKKIRVKVSDIIFDKDFAKNKISKEIIKKVIPEGKSEMNFSDFERGYLNSSC